MSNQSQNAPNWKKGDIVALLHNGGGVIHIFEAEHDPWYVSSTENWYYVLRNCKEIRLATIEDVDKKIEYQKEIVEREQARLDKLFGFSKLIKERKKQNGN